MNHQVRIKFIRAKVRDDGIRMTSRSDFTIGKGDTAPPLIVDLERSDGQPVDLSDVYKIRFEMTHGDIEISGQGEIEDDGTVAYHWKPGDTRYARTFEGHFRIEYHDGDIMTVPNSSTLTINIT